MSKESAWKRLMFAPQVALRRLAHSAVHQKPIIIGVPNQLLALRCSAQGIHELWLPALENYLVVVHIILGVLRSSGPRAIRSGLKNLNGAVGERVVERRVVTLIAQERLQLLRANLRHTPIQDHTAFVISKAIVIRI